MKFLTSHRRDIALMVLIGFVTAFIASFYIDGNFLTTGYQDWMYHAYRALSLQQFGFLSWDNIWDSGIDYWRGYQWFGAAFTAVLATLAHVSITKAMLIVTIICFVAMHITSYIAARSFGLRPAIALSVVGLLLFMTHFWVIIGFYSTMFAAVLLPLVLALWKISSERLTLRPWFALAVGLSAYVHPLLAISAAGLWLILVVLDKRQTFKRYALIDLAIIVMASFFYWYTLVFISYGSADPYQLSSDFLYIVAGVFQFTPLFYSLAVIVLVVAILKPAAFSRYGQYLFWYTAVIFLVSVVTIHSDVFAFLNRFQLYRLGFFITPVIIILFGVVVQRLIRNTRSKLYTYAPVLIFVAGCAQAFIYTSIYGYTTTNTVADPVGIFLKTHESPTGSIFINDSTVASYNNPNLRFTNGYNNQLLPQHVNLRLSKLLGATAPNFSVNTSDLTTAEHYMKVMGVQYVFLPQNSPYVKPLQEQLGFTLIQSIQAEGLSQVVLSPSWKMTNAARIDCSLAQNLASPAFPQVLASKTDDYKALDRAVIKASSVIYREDGSFNSTQFPSKDTVRIELNDSRAGQCVLLNQSHATNWQVDGATLQPTNYGMMLLTTDGSSRTVTLRHTWGMSVPAQVALGLIAFVIVIVVSIKLRKDEKNA